MILNAAMETMLPAEKIVLQNQKLQKMVERTYEKSHFYHEGIQALGLSSADIQGIHHIDKLPFTTAVDLSANYPFGLLTMPISGVTRFEQTPDGLIANGFTSQDLIWQEELIARSLVACYITRTSTLLYLPESSSSTSGRVLQQSAETLGVTLLSEETGDHQRQLQTVLQFGVTTLFATPTTLLAFADFLQSKGISNKDLPLQNILCQVHQHSTTLQNKLTETFQIPIYTLYGRPDIMSLGIGGECYQQQGIHIHDDHFYPEIINPRTGQILDDQQPGELVLTTLSREATPLIRYRTGEMTTLTHEPCACGRTSPRIIFNY